MLGLPGLPRVRGGSQRGPPRRVLTDHVAAWSADPTGALARLYELAAAVGIAAGCWPGAHRACLPQTPACHSVHVPVLPAIAKAAVLSGTGVGESRHARRRHCR